MMSKEDIEVLRQGFEKLNMKVEKPKFHKIVRQPGPERLLFLQRCLSQLCVEGQDHFAFITANGLEEQKKLEEEIVKCITAYGICKERRIVTGNGSEYDNLLFWKRFLVLIQSYQSSRNRDTSSDRKKSSSFITELLQHPQLERVLQSRKRQLHLDFTPDNSFKEVDLLHTKTPDNQNEHHNLEQSLSPTLQEQEWNFKSNQRLKENLQLLQERLQNVKEASKGFPRIETTNLSCMGEAIEQQCTQLKQIRDFYSNVEKIEGRVDFLTSIEPPDVTMTDTGKLLFNNSSPDLLNGLF